jgi:hypothetical protein
MMEVLGSTRGERVVGRDEPGSCFMSYEDRAVSRSRPSSCYNCGCEGHTARVCRQRPSCVKCGQKGHTVDFCRTPSKAWIRSGNEGTGTSRSPETTTSRK